MEEHFRTGPTSFNLVHDLQKLCLLTRISIIWIFVGKEEILYRYLSPIESTLLWKIIDYNPLLKPLSFWHNCICVRLNFYQLKFGFVDFSSAVLLWIIWYKHDNCFIVEGQIIDYFLVEFFFSYEVYPAVEYDFVPNKLNIKKETDVVHIQWTGKKNFFSTCNINRSLCQLLLYMNTSFCKGG